MSEEIEGRGAPQGADAAPSGGAGEERRERGPRGPRGGDRGEGGDRGRGGRRRFPRRKVCYFSQIRAEYVDFKDVDTLRRFVTDKGKIVPRRVTGTSAKFQRLLCTAIKRARYMALLPYSGAHK